MNSLYLKEGEILTRDTIASKIKELGKLNDFDFSVEFDEGNEGKYLLPTITVLHKGNDIWLAPCSVS